MLCILFGLSLGVAIVVSATSCGHPMATTSGHSMATSTGDRLNIFLHEILFVFLLRSFVLISFWVCSFHMLLSVGSFTGGCHWGVTKGGHWDAPKDITQSCPTKDSIKDVPGKVDIRKMNIST